MREAASTWKRFAPPRTRRVAPVSTGASILTLLTTRKAKVAIAAGVVVLAVAALLLLNRSGTVAVSANPVQSSVPMIRLVSVMVDDQDKAL